MDAIKKYLKYQRQYPHLFTPNKMIEIITDENILRDYAYKTKEKIGVVLENPYVTIVVDLIRLQEDKYYTYVRVLNIKPYAGVVIIPYYQNKVVLLKQFRHSTRSYELELPRGGSEGMESIEHNAWVEIKEEIGADAQEIEYVGGVLSDTGLVGGLVHILKCKVESIGEVQRVEGIESVVALTREEVVELIRQNKIKDCFTISALYKELLVSKA